MITKEIFDKLILDFLESHAGKEFRVRDLRELIDRSFQFGHIRRSLGRLQRRGKVRRAVYGSGGRVVRYWRAAK